MGIFLIIAIVIIILVLILLQCDINLISAFGIIGIMIFVNLIQSHSQKPNHYNNPAYYDDGPGVSGGEVDDTHDDTPPESGPGAGSNNSPGYHSVNGYYKSNGTYVHPYIRSNPDGNPYNNLNP